MVTGALRQAPILFAGSYVNAVPLLRRVAAKFDAGKYAFCSTLNVARPAGISDRLQMLLALPSAVYFATRVRAKARLLQADDIEIANIIQAAFIHRLYRGLARSILRKCRTKCLVIGNANRPFELALWAEATGSGVKTVLLPYQEMEMHPARMFSLCRGRFSHFLPFSEYSAARIRELNPVGASRGSGVSAFVECGRIVGDCPSQWQGATGTLHSRLERHREGRGRSFAPGFRECREHRLARAASPVRQHQMVPFPLRMA